MEVHQIRYFRAVAECHSFTRAAKREHVSQPTLSHQILKLENELGAKLFSRLGRTVRMTAFGEAFLPRAEIILRQISDAQTQIHEMAGTEGGRVTRGQVVCELSPGRGLCPSPSPSAMRALRVTADVWRLSW